MEEYHELNKVIGLLTALRVITLHFSTVRAPGGTTTMLAPSG